MEETKNPAQPAAGVPDETRREQLKQAAAILRAQAANEILPPPARTATPRRRFFPFLSDFRAMFTVLKTCEEKTDFLRALFIHILDRKGTLNPIDGTAKEVFEVAARLVDALETGWKSDAKTVKLPIETRAQFDALKTLEEKVAWFNAVLNYAFDGVEPAQDELTGAAAAMFQGTRERLDAETARRQRLREVRAAAGRKGAVATNQKRASEPAQPLQDLQNAAAN